MNVGSRATSRESAQGKGREKQKGTGQDSSRGPKEAKESGERESKKAKEAKEKESWEREDMAKQWEAKGPSMEGVAPVEGTTTNGNAQGQAKERGHCKRSGRPFLSNGPRSRGTIRE